MRSIALATVLFLVSTPGEALERGHKEACALIAKADAEKILSSASTEGMDTTPIVFVGRWPTQEVSWCEFAAIQPTKTADTPSVRLEVLYAPFGPGDWPHEIRENSKSLYPQDVHGLGDDAIWYFVDGTPSKAALFVFTSGVQVWLIIDGAQDKDEVFENAKSLVSRILSQL